MKREEILQLHTLTEEEARLKLIADATLQLKTCEECGEYGLTHYDCKRPQFESFADCAFRLRDKTKGFGVACKQLDELLSGTKYNGPLSFGGTRWFLFGSQPIHWIQAALLAKESQC